jgi:hypothetical protein
MAKTPSERTIESISNHGFVEILNWAKTAPPFAWFFVPTTNEEAVLGYDAALVGYKRLYIQYKRMAPSGNFKFEFRQIWTLCSVLPVDTKSYVFLSGNLTPDYPSLAAHHDLPAGGRFNAFNETFFIDAWGVLIRLCEAVNGAPLLAFPSVLPPPPPKIPGSKKLGVVTIKRTAGPLAFQISLGKAHTLWQHLILLLWAMNYHGPFLPAFPAAHLGAKHHGMGVEVAEETAACRIGRPFPLEPVQVLPVHRETSEIGRVTVIAVPVP